MDPFEVLGTWWFPGDKENSFQARLYFVHPDSKLIFLERTSEEQYQNFLISRFGKDYETGDFQRSRQHNIDAMVGEAEGQKFSLLFCRADLYWVQVAVVVRGCHLAKSREAAFPEYRVKFSGLDEWGTTRPFYREHGDASITFRVSNTQRKDEIKLARAKLEVRHMIPFPSSVGHELLLREDTEIVIKSTKDEFLSVVQIIEVYCNLLRNFLMLTTLDFVKPLYLRAVNSRKDGERSVDIFWSGKGVDLAVPKSDPSRLLFTMAEVEDHLEKIVQRFEKRTQQFRPLFRNYFSVRYLHDVYLDIRFLSYIQGLEGYHSRKNPKFICNEDESRLEKRLLDLLGSLSASTVIKDALNFDVSGFARAVVRLRNRLTHEADIPTKDYPELYRLTHQLELLILITIYKDLGLPNEIIEGTGRRLEGRIPS